jgi:NADPH:quinone reductase-like Zn-dependent oxidoreductase
VCLLILIHGGRCLNGASCSFGLQFARAAGAQVIALTSRQDKIEKMKALGAQHVINYQEVDNWHEEVKKLVSSMPVLMFP